MYTPTLADHHLKLMEQDGKMIDLPHYDRAKKIMARGSGVAGHRDDEGVERGDDEMTVHPREAMCVHVVLVLLEDYHPASSSPPVQLRIFKCTHSPKLVYSSPLLDE